LLAPTNAPELPLLPVPLVELELELELEFEELPDPETEIGSSIVDNALFTVPINDDVHKNVQAVRAGGGVRHGPRLRPAGLPAGG